MAATPGRPSPAPAFRPRRNPKPRLTPDRVVDTALRLTREHGLEGWTIRQLAAALDTWPNTIAHHVGDREALRHAVVQRVVEMMPNPPAELGWQDWFRALLHPARDIIGAHPGVARRLARDGATVPAALPIMDRGIGLLTTAGFGDRAPLAYAVLLNNAVLLVALDDDRALADRDRGQAAATLMAMPPPADAGTGWASLQPWLRQWATDPDTSRQTLYRYTIEALLTGLAADLAHRHEGHE
ncbi:TetR/AcrR family transcriptional regulator [Streptomyces sp. LaPpAH-108]|uniref:TetR/AcrR family transcriptional regulator n=1 Tax=Streptomyces sp. LaPpAH-108 TaxID=1155714 RepID=UPI0004773EC4|nr:TetR/AcrR family transcriptional regulator C-terminal domain-containing protein [Streptomyces sp. LaPpAH-108]